MTIDQYNKLNPYKPIIQLFIKTGEYVGGAEGLFKIMEADYQMVYQQGCPSCKAAMLIKAGALINEYESKICIGKHDTGRFEDK